MNHTISLKIPYLRGVLMCATALILSFSAYADLIILKNGSTISAYNIEKSKDSIFYTESADEQQNIKKISINEIFALKIGDGELQTIDNKLNEESATPVTQQTTDNDIMSIPGENNAELLSQYSSHVYQFNKKEKDKPAEYGIAVYALTPNSIISTKEIEIEFQSGIWSENSTWIPITEMAKKKKYIHKYIPIRNYTNSTVHNSQLRIIIHNKSNSNLYIDLAQTVRNSARIGYRQFFDGTVVSHGSASATSVGIGLGMIGVGSTSVASQSLNKSNPSIIVLTPHSTVELPRESYVIPENIILERYELLSNNDKAPFASSLEGLKQYQSQSYEPANTPEIISYSLVYSTSPDFSSSSYLNFSFYIKQIFGLPKLLNLVKSEIYQDRLDMITPLDNKTIIGTFKIKE